VASYALVEEPIRRAGSPAALRVRDADRRHALVVVLVP